MALPEQNRPLSEAESGRLDALLSQFQSEHAMANLEELDGFFAALICSPDTVLPSEYLPEIWGGALADDPVFADRQALQEFLGLLMRHWNGVARQFQEEEAFLPLLFQGEDGTACGNDWARGFTRGMALHPDSWQELFDDEGPVGPLIPILILAHEHDPDPERRPYKEPIGAERRETLLVAMAAGATAIYRLFAPRRRKGAVRLAAGGTAGRGAERKAGRNAACPCGSGKKYKHCCGKAALS